MVDFVVRNAGENGEGVLSVGDNLAQAMARAGLNVYTLRNLPAEIKGGASMVQVRVSDEPIGAPGDNVDILLAWNQENYDIHHHEVQRHGIILYDPAETTPDSTLPQRQFAVPLTEMANKGIGERRTKNVIALAVLCGLTGLSEELAETIMQARYGKRAQLMELNLKALQTGYEFARQSLPNDFCRVTGKRATDEARMVISGNHAISLGAIASGLQYYGGYPITPASDIMEILAKQLPRTGGVLVQTEDEIAAICSCIGASFAGRKAMTATSGPGLSLMVEALGLATMEEISLVVVDVQRGGPSTGLPTKVEQSDLDLAIHGHHGDGPRIVLAPTSIPDLFWGTIQAFNLAEKYQVPVILLSDQQLSHHEEAISVPDLSKLHVEDRRQPSEEELIDFQRYRLTEDHISPVAIPGIHPTPWVATGLEHDEHAHIQASSGRMHEIMSRKRWEKVQGAVHEPDVVHRLGNPEARFGIIGWGSSEGAIEEAIRRLSGRGIEVQALVARLMYPVPTEPIQEFLDSVDEVAVLELNHRGQYADLIQSTFCRRVLRFTKYNGLPFLTRDVCEMVETALRSREGVFAS